MKQPTTSISVRMPQDLYEQIGALATEQDRSMNWVIVHLLKEAIAARPS